MPEFDEINGETIQQRLSQPDPRVNRRGLLELMSAAGAGAIVAGLAGEINRQDQGQDVQTHEQIARAEGFAAGANAVGQAAIEAIKAMEYVNGQIARQLKEGKGVVPYFGARMMRGTARMYVSDGRIPVIIENPLLPMDITPLVEDDPSSFWILYQDWHSQDGTPYFRPFWPGGKDVTMTFTDNDNLMQPVELAICAPDNQPQGRLDRVRVVDPVTGLPMEGIAPVGLLRGIPQPPSTPEDLRNV